MFASLRNEVSVLRQHIALWYFGIRVEFYSENLQLSPVQVASLLLALLLIFALTVRGCVEEIALIIRMLVY